MTYLSILTLLLLSLFTSSDAASFTIMNNCPVTVWAAAIPDGGRRLNPGQTWDLEVQAGTNMGRIWGRTNCNFDGSGTSHCQTGDCCGYLECRGSGHPPNTLAEYALNQVGDLDFYYISLVEGFNLPIAFSPINPAEGLTTQCKQLLCTANIVSQCPSPLRVPGGCDNPCTTFQTAEYCCTGGGPCGPTDYSIFFKQKCPDAISYPQEYPTKSTCLGGTNYSVTFCPSGNPLFPALYNYGNKNENVE